MQSQRLFILGYAEHQPPLPQEFVEQTKENSGLDFDKLNKQPGFASETNVGTSPQQAVRGAAPALCITLQAVCTNSAAMGVCDGAVVRR